ncbi:MAG: hypothetical protein U0795_21875 [Pirellulales bacterium]
MPIAVTCPSCHARFQVSDKFGGKTGPCPKCKGQIRIPEKSEEVIIHAPEDFGPKTASGKAVLKPIERVETEVTATGVTAVLGSIVAVVSVAAVVGRFLFDRQPPVAFLALGAIALAPPLVFSGYTFLREQELEPYRGRALWVRVLICSVVYAAMWAGYWYVSQLWGAKGPELFHLVFILPILIGIGSLASFASLDLQFGNAAMHCIFYVLVTVLLRWVVGISPY